MRLIVLIAAAAIAAPPVSAQSLKPSEVLSSISVRPLAKPNPVAGSDGRVHLAYELHVANSSHTFVTIDQVEAVDLSGKALWTLAGEQLESMTMLYSGEGTTLPPGGTGLVFMDVSVGAGAPVPKSVAVRVKATRQAVGPDGKPAPLPEGLPVPATFTFTSQSVDVGAPARVIAAPLRGRNWVATNGCCGRISPHRGAVLTVNGVIKAPERFAIDWEQINSDNRAFAGDKRILSNWAFYGAPVYSVADGTVVNTFDGVNEQVPGRDIEQVSTEAIGGNMIVVDIGGGAFAFYAHLQRGSLKAKLGEKVRKGQVLGLLGNTGNSTAPHLHFHLMDGPSPLNANGLPYVFDRFTSRGMMESGQDDSLDDGEVVRIESKWTGEHRDRLPMDGQVVDFD